MPPETAEGTAEGGGSAVPSRLGNPPAMWKCTRTTFEMGCTCDMSTCPGAVPSTTKTVIVESTFVPKKPGAPTCQSLKVVCKLCTRSTALSWNTPARFAFGPPAACGVVDSRTTRPGAPGSGRPGPKVFEPGRFRNGWYPFAAERVSLSDGVRACSEISTLKTPPAPATPSSLGVITSTTTGGCRP